MQKVWPYLLVGIGGFIGANARYLLAAWSSALFGSRFPVGTFVINISGSFLLGVIGTLVADRLVDRPDEIRLLLGVGFLGAYTTFSTFEYETHALLENGSWMSAMTNIFLSPFIGLLAVRAGVIAAKTLFSR